VPWDFRKTPLAVLLIKTGLFEWESLLHCEVCSSNVHIFLRISFKGMGSRKDPRYIRIRGINDGIISGEHCISKVLMVHW
jgi:hypothetical protein